MTDAASPSRFFAFAGAVAARADLSARAASPSADRDPTGELRRIPAADGRGGSRADAREIARLDRRIVQLNRALSRLMRGSGAAAGIAVAPGRSAALMRLDYAAEVRVGGALARETASYRAWRDLDGAAGHVQTESRSLTIGDQSLSWRFAAASGVRADGAATVSAEDRIAGSDVADVLSSVEIDAISLGRFGERQVPGDLDAGAGDDRVLFDGRLAGLDYGRVDLGEGADVFAGAARSVRDLDGGAGGDAISLRVQLDASVSGGDGGDAIALVAGGRAAVDGGEGGDAISVLAQEAQVDGGAGDDAISAVAGRAAVDAGTGDDAVSVLADRVDRVAGGAGNDALTVEGRRIGAVEGGAGDDAIAVSGGEARRVSGGAGDDLILVAAERATVTFAAGDGHDRLTVARGSTVLVQAEGDHALSRQDDGALLLTLAGGETLRIEGAGEVFFAPPGGLPASIHATAIDARL
ncbi:calcium-binding protein [Albimonas pacifica]|uniref:Hemolysin-type calcium-binding repeat-containing protein n=1 Tax=Albimonas pacifica TaxID=1114924 RepID=A0A1I3LVX5_9RHOB|nr:calcium-binding protein [Albimonas pacifica]SFI88837.1 hypothetical protein SAMN05216258_110198 [Albimonas pacifica]